jgi:uncharacterized protein (DUF2164 family)
MEEIYLIMPIKIPKEQKEQIISNFKTFFEEERSETIGDLAAEQIIDYMIKELAPYIYNKAIEDARQILIQKITSLEEELYSLEKPINLRKR